MNGTGPGVGASVASFTSMSPGSQRFRACESDSQAASDRAGESPVVVLLVEGDAARAAEVLDLLRRNAPQSWSFLQAGTLEEAVALSRRAEAQLVLLDLHLPDARGMRTFNAFGRASLSLPVVLLIDEGDEALAVRALRKGAQDYLLRGRLDGPTLVRSIRYALERHRLQSELQVERELRRHVATAPVSPHEVQAALRESNQALFHDLVRRYADAMNAAVELQVLKSGGGAVSRSLRQIAAILGEHGAGPRDVVEIHSAALRDKLRHTPSRRGRAYVDEARLMVLELMGHLACHYRDARNRGPGGSGSPSGGGNGGTGAAERRQDTEAAS